MQFAFYGNHINRYKQKLSKKNVKLDVILAVADIEAFHKENLQRNKPHYTMMNRATRNRVLNYFQSRGAKVHFNYGIKMVDEELAEQTGEPQEVVDVRYGVISYENLARDLEHWETMLVSTMMQRPIKTIVKNEEIWAHQMRNLKSAVRITCVSCNMFQVSTGCFEDAEWRAGVAAIREHREHPALPVEVHALAGRQGGRGGGRERELRPFPADVPAHLAPRVQGLLLPGRWQVRHHARRCDQKVPDVTRQ